MRLRQLNVLLGCELDFHLGGMLARQGTHADSGHVLSGGDGDTPARKQERGLRMESLQVE